MCRHTFIHNVTVTVSHVSHVTRVAMPGSFRCNVCHLAAPYFLNSSVSCLSVPQFQPRFQILQFSMYNVYGTAGRFSPKFDARIVVDRSHAHKRDQIIALTSQPIAVIQSHACTPSAHCQCSNALQHCPSRAVQCGAWSVHA